LKRGIEKGVEAIVKELREQISKPVAGHEKITQVASISANDEEIGKLIAEAMNTFLRLAVTSNKILFARD